MRKKLEQVVRVFANRMWMSETQKNPFLAVTSLRFDCFSIVSYLFYSENFCNVRRLDSGIVELQLLHWSRAFLYFNSLFDATGCLWLVWQHRYILKFFWFRLVLLKWLLLARLEFLNSGIGEKNKVPVGYARRLRLGRIFKKFLPLFSFWR